MVKLDKATFIKLAEAYINDYDFLSELDSKKRELADKYGIEKDFLGMDYFGGKLTETVFDLLGEEFAYWYCDCDKDFDKYNKGVELPDGTHPTASCLEDLWEYSCKQEEE